MVNSFPSTPLDDAYNTVHLVEMASATHTFTSYQQPTTINATAQTADLGIIEGTDFQVLIQRANMPYINLDTTTALLDAKSTYPTKKCK